MLLCANCDRPLSGNQKIWCSKKCHGHSRTMTSKTGYKPEIEAKIGSGKCLCCGIETERRKKYCSVKCARLFHKGLKPFIAAEITCHCGTSFLQKHSRHLFCSDRCTTNGPFIHKRRREKLRAAFVEPVSRKKVFELAGWKCQICGVDVSHGIPYRSDSPEIDHIVPLTRGGLHEYANCRCVCRSCNHPSKIRAVAA